METLKDSLPKQERELHEFINKNIPENLRAELWDYIDNFVIYNRDWASEIMYRRWKDGEFDDKSR
jgi:hypothetical protein